MKFSESEYIFVGFGMFLSKDIEQTNPFKKYINYILII